MIFLPRRSIGSRNLSLTLRFLSGLFLWCVMVICLHLISKEWRPASSLWSLGFVALQMYVAVQILLPILKLEPTQRSRTFYLLAAAGLVFAIWLMSRFSPNVFWQPFFVTAQSALLLLTATAVGTVLARFMTRVRDIVPICIVMSLADFSSWLAGPTAGFSRQIESYYRSPKGPAPLIDLVLIKLAFPGVDRLAPVFGISDWIMVVFFISAAKNFNLNDNLLGISPAELIRLQRTGLYLPVSAAALFGALMLAQTTGFFVPALPFMAFTMLLWYGLQVLLASKN